MATRDVVLSIGSGPDEQATKGKMQIHRVYPGPDGDGVLIFDTPEVVAVAKEPPTKVSLEVDQYFTFTPVEPKGDPITAKISAGAGEILLSALALVNPRSLEKAAVPLPAWFQEIQQVQTDVAGIVVDVDAAQSAAAAAQATADAAAPQAELDDLVEVVGGKADSAALAPVALSGSASDINTGTLPSSVLPPLAINETFVVASQAAMLALTAQRGDIAVRSDLTPARVFILTADVPTVLGNWTQITAAGGVLSVAGLVDAVSAAGLKTALNLPADTSTALTAKADAAGTTTALATKADKGLLSGLPVWVYGNSYTIDNPPNATAGKEWHKQLPAKIGAGTVTTYGISGTRIFDVCAALINQAAFSGLAVPVAGSRWPGTSSRTGLIVIDAAFNDHGHYPDMTAPLAIPTALSSNNRYLNGVIGAYRAALALASSESRIEQTSAVLSGTWVGPSSAASYSGGSVSYTTTPGSAGTFTVTPPQSGPLAGKVFLLTYKLEAALGTMAQIAVSVDGGAPTNVTPAAWEQYKGSTGSQVNVIPECIAVTVPVDGAAHSVAFTHAGSSGHFMYADTLIVPSTSPNPIAVMERTTAPNAVLFSAAQVAVWRQNSTVIQAVIRAVVAEFPNAFSVPSTLTSNGLYSLDGIHPNDRGMEQIDNDLIAAAEAKLLAFMRNRVQQLRPDSDFAKV